MANHTIDCEFCGADMRSVGPNCCSKQVDLRNKEHLDRMHAAELDAKFLKPYGLEPGPDALGYFTRLDAKDVVGVIRKIKAGLL